MQKGENIPIVLEDKKLTIIGWEVLYDLAKIKLVLDQIVDSIGSKEKGWQRLAIALLDKWFPGNASSNQSFTQQNTLITDKAIYQQLKKDLGTVFRPLKSVNEREDIRGI